MTRNEVDNLPLGVMLDQIACWQMANGAKEKRVLQGSLFEQMNSL